MAAKLDPTEAGIYWVWGDNPGTGPARFALFCPLSWTETAIIISAHWRTIATDGRVGHDNRIPDGAVQDWEGPIAHPSIATLSPMALSNLYTMGCAVVKDPRQDVPTAETAYHVPSFDVRKLRARLIMEEALETIAALGIAVTVPYQAPDNMDANGILLKFGELDFNSDGNQCDVEGVVDGCCDLNYVSIGTLCCFGVPDVPHMAEVNRANNAKFPKGVAITNKDGKFQKPPGWQPPDHKKVAQAVDMKAISLKLIADKQK